MKKLLKSEEYRWLRITTLFLVIFICLYYLGIDTDFIKHSILRVPRTNSKGVTQVEFEKVGDKIKVGMDKSTLTSLERLASFVHSNEKRTLIQWSVCIAKNKCAELEYTIELSRDGKILKIEKSEGVGTFLD